MTDDNLFCKFMLCGCENESKQYYVCLANEMPAVSLVNKVTLWVRTFSLLVTWYDEKIQMGNQKQS